MTQITDTEFNEKISNGKTEFDENERTLKTKKSSSSPIGNFLNVFSDYVLFSMVTFFQVWFWYVAFSNNPELLEKTERGRYVEIIFMCFLPPVSIYLLVRGILTQVRHFNLNPKKKLLQGRTYLKKD